MVCNFVNIFVTVEKYVIVLTDGLSSHIIRTKLRAAELRMDGVKVITIGVGSSVNHQELLDIAGHPSYVFSLHNTDSLHAVLRNSMTGCQGMYVVTIKFYFQLS